MADAKEAYEQSTAHGAIGVTPPAVLRDDASATEQVIAEILMYGDCLLRFVSGSYQVMLPIHTLILLTSARGWALWVSP